MKCSLSGAGAAARLRLPVVEAVHRPELHAAAPAAGPAAALTGNPGLHSSPLLN